MAGTGQSDQAAHCSSAPRESGPGKAAGAARRTLSLSARAAARGHLRASILFAGSGNGLQFAYVRGVLGARPGDAFIAAELDDEEGQPVDRQLHLLFGVESA